jgi:chromosome partitioning protein
METELATNVQVINRPVPEQSGNQSFQNGIPAQTSTNKTKESKRKKPTEKFSEMKFLASHLAEFFGLSKPTIYELINEGVIKPSSYQKRGNTDVAVFDWDAIIALSTRYKDRIRKSNFPKIATAANMKGGTGKSTMTTQVAMTSSAIGLKTLVMDFDPQMHASKCLQFDDAQLQKMPTIKDVVISDVPIREAIAQITPLLYLLPANLRLSRLELELYPMHNREELVKCQIRDIANDFDLVIIDTNPSASLLNISSLAAADEAWIVTETDHLSTEGLATVFDVLKSIHKAFKRCPQIRIIANQFDVRQGMAREAVGLLQSHFSDVLVPTIVSQCQDIKEAQKRKQAVWQYNKQSVGAKEIFALTRNLVGVNGVNNA